MIRQKKGLLAAAAVMILSGPAAWGDEKSPTAVPLGKLAACRTISEDAARLACFDREVGAFDMAVKERRIAVVDQADIRKTRRTLFGIALPTVKLFDNNGEPEIKELVTTVKSTRQGDGGRIVFTVEDGAIWTQTDDWPVFYSVRPGQKVTLKRGAIGSYFAAFDRSVSVRVKRLH